MANYNAIQARSREATMMAILNAASNLLVTEGPSSLSMRRIAQDVGCSTTVLYTLFCDKQGLANALWIEGFKRLKRATQSIPQNQEPLAYLFAICHSYRKNALENLSYYALMFERVIPDFIPSEEASYHSWQTFEVLLKAVQLCEEAGIFIKKDPLIIAAAIWATVHGVLSLQLTGFFPRLFPEAETSESIFNSTVEGVISGFRQSPQSNLITS